VGVSIDWSTATVTAEKHGLRHGLRLEVELVGDPDTFWKNEFSALKESRGLSDWAPDVPYHTTLTVHGITPGIEEDVRRELDAMVEQANVEAARGRREWDEKKQKEASDTDTLEQAAQDMTERFRAGPQT
jgi:hypothetical protein